MTPPPIDTTTAALLALMATMGELELELQKEREALEEK